MNSNGRSRSPSPVKNIWSSIRRTAKTEKDQNSSAKAGDAAGVNNQGFKEDDSKRIAMKETKKSSHSRY